jgi:hypothetical protein
MSNGVDELRKNLYKPKNTSLKGTGRFLYDDTDLDTSEPDMPGRRECTKRSMLRFRIVGFAILRVTFVLSWPAPLEITYSNGVYLSGGFLSPCLTRILFLTVQALKKDNWNA